MDAGHGRLDRVCYGGIGPACAARWRGGLRVEAVGLEFGEGKAGGGCELADNESLAKEADRRGSRSPRHSYGRIHREDEAASCLGIPYAELQVARSVGLTSKVTDCLQVLWKGGGSDKDKELCNSNDY